MYGRTTIRLNIIKRRVARRGQTHRVDMFEPLLRAPNGWGTDYPEQLAGLPWAVVLFLVPVQHHTWRTRPWTMQNHESDVHRKLVLDTVRRIIRMTRRKEAGKTERNRMQHISMTEPQV
jgi:hypothetical protein